MRISRRPALRAAAIAAGLFCTTLSALALASCDQAALSSQPAGRTDCEDTTFHSRDTMITVIETTLVHPTDPQHPGENLVVNGSFEKRRIVSNEGNPGYDTYREPTYSSIPGWYIDGIDHVNQIQWPAREGTQSVDINGPDRGEIMQTIATKAGETYEIGLSYAANPHNTNPALKQFRVLVNSLALDTFEVDVYGTWGWTDTTIVFTALGDDTLKFQGVSYGNAGVALDRITVRRK